MCDLDGGELTFEQVLPDVVEDVIFRVPAIRRSMKIGKRQVRRATLSTFSPELWPDESSNSGEHQDSDRA